MYPKAAKTFIICNVTIKAMVAIDKKAKMNNFFWRSFSIADVICIMSEVFSSFWKIFKLFERIILLISSSFGFIMKKSVKENKPAIRDISVVLVGV